MAASLISSAKLDLPSSHPFFSLSPSQIEIVKEPHEFYGVLRRSIETAKRRVALSSLYLGVGPLEDQLTADLTSALLTNSNLNVHLLFDYTRATRVEKVGEGTRSCKQSLQPLAALSRAKVSFFLSPRYSHWFKRYFILPLPKINEVISLHHMKAFVFDDDVIISGANLSDQYFTNRADRYIIFRNCPTLANYFSDLIETIGSFSLKLKSDGSFHLDSSWKYHPLSSEHTHKFIAEARERMIALNTKYNRNLQECIDSNQDDTSTTIAMPMIQMDCLGIRDDLTYTCKLISSCPPGASLRLASGYFNLTKDYIDILLKKSQSNVQCNVLMASEPVNSFYKANGLLGKIPSVYSQFSRDFLRQIITRDSSIQLWSYLRPNWTFHTKGLWIHYPSSDVMVATIGSPNFGWRSVFRDNECQVLLITRDASLKSSLTAEYEAVWKYGHRITKETDLPRVSLWLQLVSRIIKRFF